LLDAATQNEYQNVSGAATFQGLESRFQATAGLAA